MLINSSATSFIMKTVSVFLFISLSITFVTSFPNGVPSLACFLQSPSHGREEPQTSPAPIRIVLSQRRIRPGQTINIRIEGIDPNYQFRGFFIQPRNVVSPNSLVGTMDTNNDGVSQITDCSGPTTATHVDPELKKSVSVNWTAPQFVGGVRIQ